MSSLSVGTMSEADTAEAEAFLQSLLGKTLQIIIKDGQQIVIGTNLGLRKCRSTLYRHVPLYRQRKSVWMFRQSRVDHGRRAMLSYPTLSSIVCLQDQQNKRPSMKRDRQGHRPKPT